MDCVFCQIIASESAAIIDSDDKAVAFLDINPIQRGHVLVVPRRHVADFTVDPSLLSDVAPLAGRMANHLRTRLKSDGLNTFTSAGSVAGQEVFHAHMHVVPRYEARPGLAALWQSAQAPVTMTSDELSALYDLLTRE